MSDDASYGQFLTTLADITSQRDSVASEIKSLLDSATFDNQPISEHQEESLVHRARAIIDQVEDLARGNGHGDGRGHDNGHDGH